MNMKRSLVALLLTCSCAFAADPEPLGIQLWSLRAQMTAGLPSGMAQVKSLGFTRVETAGTYNHTAKEMKALIDANGLKVVGCHIPYERLQTDLDGAIAEAKLLGASYVVVAWVPHKTAFDVPQAHVAAANFNAWGAKMKAAGLGFGFHTHGYEFAPQPDGTTPFDVMMKETDPGLVFCEMDVFWVVQGGIDPVKLLEKYPDRFKAFHIKDMRKGAPVGLYQGSAPASDNVAVGTGQIDFHALIATGRKLGVPYYFIEDETADPLGNIPPSVAYMKSLGISQ
jgi:sugar phosphate isomerase/epimerase